MVDRPLVMRKIEKIGTYLSLIRQKKDPGIDVFQKDRDLQSIVLFNLIQAIQSCIDIAAHIISDAGWDVPGTQAEFFETLSKKKVISPQLARKMIQMAGFRNRIVHEYEMIDMKIVHRIWRKNSRDLDAFCKAVVKKFGL
jgi:uncharacterized protein YutE (UPF0331/DUF86 family)